jgi:DNA-binding transcriptional LysR family regulator
MSLAGIDLNLLVALDVLLSECNVTRAAERMAVGQPAMSASLRRLRKHFDDPLLVKEGRTLVLTSFAESLIAPVHEALTAVNGVMGASQPFDPAHDQRTFTIVASDYVTLILLRPLFQRLAVEAPDVRLNVVPMQPDFVEQLRRGQADLLILPTAVAGQVSLPHIMLFSDRFLLACDRDNPDVSDIVTPEQFSRLPYLSYSIGQLAALVDIELDEVGVERRVEVRTQSFVIAPFLLTGTGLVSIVHERLAYLVAEQAGLRLLEPPVALRPIVEAMYWSPRHTADPAHTWLRELLIDVAVGEL